VLRANAGAAGVTTGAATAGSVTVDDVTEASVGSGAAAADADCVVGAISTFFAFEADIILFVISPA
jgi:hypothetical protein